MTKVSVPICGPFVPDPDLPHADHAGRRACLNCHLMGRPGEVMPDT